MTRPEPHALGTEADELQGQTGTATVVAREVPTDVGQDGISVLLDVTSSLVKRWKLVVGFPVAATVVAVVVSLVLHPTYTATASFVPETERGGTGLPAGVIGLAAQFGIGAPGGTNSSAFYADVLASGTMRTEVLETRLPDPRASTPGDSAVLLDILGVRDDVYLARLESGRVKLRSAVSVSVDSRTDIVTVSVETKYQQLSADVANLLIALLNRFNLERRQSSALQRRRFVQDRVSEMQAEMYDAEEQLGRFLEQNRNFESSPSLRFQADRLQRQVSIKQEVLAGLLRSYEQARIQEVNDTPVITVIDRAIPPQKKSGPRRKLYVTLTFTLALLAAGFAAFAGEHIQRAKDTNAADFGRLRSDWRALRRELRAGIGR